MMHFADLCEIHRALCRSVWTSRCTLQVYMSNMVQIVDLCERRGALCRYMSNTAHFVDLCEHDMTLCRSMWTASCTLHISSSQCSLQVHCAYLFQDVSAICRSLYGSHIYEHYSYSKIIFSVPYIWQKATPIPPSHILFAPARVHPSPVLMHFGNYLRLLLGGFFVWV